MRIAAVMHRGYEVCRVDVYDGEKAERVYKENLVEKFNADPKKIKENLHYTLIEDSEVVDVIAYLKNNEIYNPHIDVGSDVWRLVNEAADEIKELSCKLQDVTERLNACQYLIENDEGVIKGDE